MAKEMKEVWKPIEGYEGLYEVSNMGNVKALKKAIRSPHGGTAIRSEKMLKQNTVSKGYKSVRLYKTNGENTLFRVHRLVALVFIPNPENKPQVNHLNCIKADNRVENLEWATAQENVIHSWSNGRQTTEHLFFKTGRHKEVRKEFDAKRRKPIVCNETGINYESCSEACKALNIRDSHLSDHLHGVKKRKRIRGLTFSFINK